MSSSLTDRTGRPLDLVLYMYETCPYCLRVMASMKSLGLEIPMRNIRQDPAALAEMIRVGGSKQVPCLFVNGKPLYESSDIIRYLQNEVRR